MDPKSSSCGERMLALYEYTAERPDELSFKEGDIIEVVYKDCPEGWWVGKLNDKTGLFPLNFVQQIPANNDNNNNENVLRINPVSGINLQISLPSSETPAQQSNVQMQGSSCGVKQTGHDTAPIPNKRDLFRNVRQQNGGGGSTTTTTTTTTSQEVTPEQLEHMSKQLHEKLTNTKDEPKFDLEAGADRAIQSNKDKSDNKDAELISLLLSAQLFLKNYSKQSTERMNLENQRITMLKNLIDHKAVMLENLSDRVNTYLGQQKKTYQEANKNLEQVRQQLQQAKSQNHH